MEKSFRDILAEFLEGNDSDFTSAPLENPGLGSASTYVFEPLWRPDFAQNPSRAGLSRYRGGKKTHSSPVTPQPKKTPPPPPPEVVIPLEKLAQADLACVKELISLGADLTQGLSPARLKKAHRLLARKFHPDRLNGATPEQLKVAAEKFRRVQESYARLAAFLNSK